MSFDLDLGYLAVVAALTLRFSILAATLPLMDGRSVPVLWRLALAVTCALALAPVVSREMTHPVDLAWPAIVAEAGRSLLIGTLLASTIGIVFTAVKYAGHVVGMQIGFAIVNTFDPQTGAQHSALSQVYYLLAVMLFFALDAHHTLVTTMVQTCHVAPLFAPVDVVPGAWLLIQESGAIFKLGLQLAAPCIIVLLLVSATMGVVVKTVPQINVLIVGFPIKIAVGLMTVGLSLSLYKEIFQTLLQGMDERVVRMLTALN